MKRGLLAGAVVLAVAILAWSWVSNITGGWGYWIAGLGESGVQLAEPKQLTQTVQRGRGVGGVMGTLVWLKKGIDVEAEYAVSIPTQKKPIVAMAGCQQPRKIMGMVAIVPMQLDVAWMERELGREEAQFRVNSLLLQCLAYGMAGGVNGNVYERMIEEMVKPAVRGGIFAIGGEMDK